MGKWTIGIIGGSGLYRLKGLEHGEWLPVSSPFGEPSDEILFGSLGDVELRFLPRHGRGHRIAPGDINARANIDALKRAGCTDILAVSAIGSLREELEPGHFVAFDQFIDRTHSGPGGREASFFGTGMVAHVPMADPVCPRLAAMAADAVEAAGGTCARGGTCVIIEGPQFSTRAESHMYRQWGGDGVNMTALPEAKLAREAELPYAMLGMVTDYDCWRDNGHDVDVAEIVARLHSNSALALATIDRFLAALPAQRAPSPIDTALDGAIMTAPEARDPAMKARLEAILRRIDAG